MPVPQTLAKKLNKDVFQTGKTDSERGAERKERSRAHVADTLQATEEARTGGAEKKDPIKADKSKSEPYTGALGERAHRRGSVLEERLRAGPREWIQLSR